VSGYARQSSGYRKLFATLPPLRVQHSQLRALGCVGGPCDLGIGSNGGEDSSVDAAWPFFGQFVAHDLAADRSRLDEARVCQRIINFRAARLDLECLYGPGPAEAPYLFAKDDPAKFLLAPVGRRRTA
jgi:hypothetical protein